jgi:hypothetical protein
MKLLDPLQGLIATIGCIEFQTIFSFSTGIVVNRLRSADDKGDIITQIQYQIKNNPT